MIILQALTGTLLLLPHILLASQRDTNFTGLAGPTVPWPHHSWLV